MKNDLVDLVLAQWAKEKPDLNAEPMAVMGRIVRTANIFSTELGRVFSELGINSGEFDVLATLLRSGPPYSLTPSRLLQTLMLSSGAMTNRLDRLEAKGLIVRQADPNDRRGVKVALSAPGYTLINEAIFKHVAKGDQLLEPFSANERAQLAQLLKKFLLHHDVSSPPVD